MAAAKMWHIQGLFYVIVIFLQIVSGQEDGGNRRRYQDMDALQADYYNMIVPDMEEALKKMETLLITAESNNDDTAYEGVSDILGDIVEATRNSNNAYKFIKAKGIDRIIPQHLKSNNRELKKRTLIFMKSLFDVAPTTTAASMPIVIVDRILEIFEKEDLQLKAHALELLGYWLPENPRVQARVMKIKGLVPFYDQVDKLDTRVLIALLSLFNTILTEHIQVRSDSQKHLVDNDKMKFYLRIGLLEHMSTGTVCNGLMNIFMRLWSLSTKEHDVLIPVFELLKNIKPYCLESYENDDRAKKLFVALSEFVNDSDNTEFFDTFGQNMTEAALVIGEYTQKLKYLVKDEMYNKPTCGSKIRNVGGRLAARQQKTKGCASDLAVSSTDSPAKRLWMAINGIKIRSSSAPLPLYSSASPFNYTRNVTHLRRRRRRRRRLSTHKIQDRSSSDPKINLQ